MADAVKQTLLQPKRIEHVVFDFDSTLFDTEKKKHGFYEIAKCHGYTLEEAKAMYDESRAIGNRMMISIAGFLSVLRERLARDGKQFQAKEVSEIIDWLNKGVGLLPGAKALLEFSRRQGIPRLLLSLGVREWQAEKVVKSGVDTYFSPEDIVYTDFLDVGKITIIRDRFGASCDGRGLVIFNDKPDETREILRAFPKMFAYVRREVRDDRYEEKDFIELRKEFSGRVIFADDLRTLGEQFEDAWKNTRTRRKQIMFERAFIDFDDTLYHAHRMAQDMKAIFSAVGVSPEDFERTFLLALHGKTHDDFHYTFDLHFKILKDLGYDLPVESLRPELTSLLTKPYADEDAEEFLESIREKSEETILLTAGDEAFQLERLAATELSAYFDDVVIISTRKEFALAERIDNGKRYLFVNDDLEQNIAVREQFPNVVVVTKRHPVKYQEDELRASGIPYFSTLKDIATYVESL